MKKLLLTILILMLSLSGVNAVETTISDTSSQLNGTTSFYGQTFFYDRANYIFNGTDTTTDILNVTNQNTLGVASIRAENNNGSSIQMGVFGQTISQSLFPDQIDSDENALGITGEGGDLFFVAQGGKSIIMGTTPDSNLSNTNFTLEITPTGDLLLKNDLFLEDTNKKIYVEEGDGIVIENLDVLQAGGITAKLQARDSNNDTITNAFWQNGRNNSFSGTMNSFGTVPKSWVMNCTTNNVINYTKLSDYIEFTSWVQEYLGLLSEGRKYSADTTGRGLPLLWTGDLEVIRSSTIHEGLEIFKDFEYISREGNDLDVFGAGIHVRQNRTETIGVASGEVYDVFEKIDFENGLLSPFSVIQQGGAGDEWQNVLASNPDVNCPNTGDSNNDRCLFAQNGDHIIERPFSTVNGNSCYLSFYITTTGLDPDDDFVVDVTLGASKQTIYSITNGADVTDLLVNQSLSYNNTPNLDIIVTLNASGDADEVNLDNFEVTCTAIDSTLQNVTRFDSAIYFGDGSRTEDGVPLTGIYYNDSDNSINFYGNTSFTTTEQSQLNVTDSLYVQNNITSLNGFLNGKIEVKNLYSGIINSSLIPDNYLKNTGDIGTGGFILDSLNISNIFSAKIDASNITSRTISSDRISDSYLLNTGDSGTGGFTLDNLNVTSTIRLGSTQKTYLTDTTLEIGDNGNIGTKGNLNLQFLTGLGTKGNALTCIGYDFGVVDTPYCYFDVPIGIGSGDSSVKFSQTYTSEGTHFLIQNSSGNDRIKLITDTDGGYLELLNPNNSSSTTIKASGSSNFANQKVGINNPSPSEALDVNGSIKTTENIIFSNNCFINQTSEGIKFGC